MAGDWHKWRATPQRLWRFFKEGVLPPDAWERSQDIAGYVPTTSEWAKFVERLLLASGTIFLVAGIFFFFAFNWEDLPRLGRFAIIQSAVVIATVLAFFLKIETWSGRVALAAAAMLIGATFAVVGQAYQTGADSYRLFMMWAILITGWVLISRWNIMYFIWLILINLALSLYWQQVISNNFDVLNLILIGLNFGFVISWDIIAKVRQIDFMQKGRWFLYLLMIPALMHATSMTLDGIFGWAYRYVTLGRGVFIIYGALMIVLGIIYIFFRRDLLMLTMASVSVLVVATAGIGRILWVTMYENNYSTTDPFTYFFFMGIITIGLTTGLVFGLRQLQARWGDET